MNKPEKYERLMEAALKEFSQRSFDEASMNSILKHAGVSKGVFYYHFQNKMALYMQIVEKASELKWEFIGSQLSGDVSNDASIFELFCQQARAGIRFAEQFPEYHQLAHMLVLERNPEIRAYLDAATANSGRLEALIDWAQKKGDFSSEYTTSFLTSVIGYLFAHFHDVFPDEQDAYKNLDAYISMMKNGLGS